VQLRGFSLFAIGHFALGYLVGKSSSKLAKVKLNMPLLFATSVLPDIDLLLRFLTHRGPTHSLLAITALMIPFFIIYRKQAIPYYAALLSHIFLGDYFTGGIELFWPLFHGWFGALNLEVTSLPSASVELALFILTIPIMFKLGDLQTFLKPNNRNWALIIPFGATLVPLLSLSRGPENALPTILAIPSIFYMCLIAFSIFIWLRARNNTDRKPQFSIKPLISNVSNDLRILLVNEHLLFHLPLALSKKEKEKS
jgi:membrane-bound metal-dependent hydrolase YbcI (DUF457 family)